MNALFVLIPVLLVFLLIAIGIFIWAMRSNQFENLESAALDILGSEKDTKVKTEDNDAS